jgi:hypothetical protein
LVSLYLLGRALDNVDPDEREIIPCAEGDRSDIPRTDRGCRVSSSRLVLASRDRSDSVGFSSAIYQVFGKGSATTVKYKCHSSVHFKPLNC